jgi:hypothetical protein
MENKDFMQAESNQRQHHEVIFHQERMNLIIETEEYNLFSILKPTLFKDGNSWCCLYGDDIITGIVGFGDTPYKSILNFNKAWHNENGKITD